jgi:MYXO-CTERM domain-containing protein
VTGYVFDVSQNAWTEPPKGVNGCAADQVFWPKFDLCYIPETGFIFNPAALPPPGRWEFYGVDYTQGKAAPSDEGGCAVSGVPTGRDSSGWWIVGLLGAALGGLAYRRRA